MLNCSDHVFCFLVFFWLFFFLPWAHRPSAAVSLLCQSFIVFSILAVTSLPTPDGEGFGVSVSFSIMGPWAWVEDPSSIPFSMEASAASFCLSSLHRMTLLYIKSGHDLPPSPLQNPSVAYLYPEDKIPYSVPWPAHFYVATSSFWVIPRFLPALRPCHLLFSHAGNTSPLDLH